MVVSRAIHRNEISNKTFFMIFYFLIQYSAQNKMTIGSSYLYQEQDGEDEEMMAKVAFFNGCRALCQLGRAAVRFCWGPVLGVAVTVLAFVSATGAGATGFKLLDGVFGVRCIAHVAVVHHKALGKHAARGVILGIEARTDAVRNLLVLGRGDTDGRGHDQGDGGDRDTHGGCFLMFVASGVVGFFLGILEK